MKKTMTLLSMTAAIMGTVMAASAEADTLKNLPSPALASFVSGRTFDARIAGFGWGEEDDPDSLGIDFTVVEPLIYPAEEIESLEKGDVITAGFEIYTVSSVTEEDGRIIVKPEELWLTPVTFTQNEDGVYTGESDEGILRGDSFSFQGRLSHELVYVNADGEQLTAGDLLKDMVEEAIDTDSSVPKITFDEKGYVSEIDFSES